MSARKYGKSGRTLQITLKYSDFHVITRQATFPATHSRREVYENAVSLLEQNWSTQKPVRLLGISLSGFDEESSFAQLSLFDTDMDQTKNEKQEQLDMAIDKIKSRLGTDKIGRAALLNKKRQGR
jgi:DNA polymerase-4